MARIEPVAPPYDEAVEAQLDAMMPPGVPPLLLFRTFVRNMPMTRAMTRWGSYELSKHLSLSMRDREIVIDRTCARCGCEYEWGVHVKYFAERVGFTYEQVASLTHGEPSDACWSNARDRLLIRAVDALHERADIDDALWASMAEEFDETQLLELTMLSGWYHAIAYTANATRLDPEPWAPRFADYARDIAASSAEP